MSKERKASQTENDSSSFIMDTPIGWKQYRVCFLLKDGYEGMKIGPFGSQLKVEEMTTEGYKVYGQENIIACDFQKGIRYINEDKFNNLKVYQIQPGDILITMMGSSGRCQISTDDIKPGIMDSHLVRLRVVGSLIYPCFFQILIEETEYLKYQIKILGKGSIMHGLNSVIIKNLQVLLPPLVVQDAILKFLKYKTALIDQYIANKKKQIQLLDQLRTSIISEAVTRGVDPDGEKKNSGVEWLGNIPKHWVNFRLRFLTLFNPSKNKISELHKENAEITFLPMENVSESGELNLSDTANISDVWDGYTYCHNGDVILAKITPCFENGKGAYLSGLRNDVAFGSTEFFVMRPQKGIIGKFLYYLTITDLFRDIGESQMQGSAGQQRVPLYLFRPLSNRQFWNRKS